jgi:glycerophosphoryl diester phosphodiesterase
MPHHPLWVAHRGASREHRENTLAAFSRALELGADAIELDVRCAADGVVMVHHDADVVVGGQRVAVAAATSAELGAIDLGDGERIPTLDDVCDLVGGGAELFVEIKGAGIEAEVLAALRRHGGPVAIHSFDHEAIARAAELAPHARRGLLYDAAPVDLAATVARTRAHDLWPRGDLATAALVQEAHALGLRVIAWTINDPADGATLIARGVDGICTDDVRWLRSLPA